ncbi:polysaccharide deacetylase family protein [Bacillus gobiensis]|uniref:polysaccharide deacetylase family protein n=1 Tax=Bacillus gobiensis TaxID=1441095 RepID=UPI003D1F3449
MLQKRKKLQPSAGYLLVKTAFLLGLCLVLLGTWSSSSAKNGQQEKAAIPTDNGSIRETQKNDLLKKIQHKQLALHMQTKEEIQQKEDAIRKKHNEQNKKTVYLTFDDGPSPYTQKLNDVLNANDVNATFFMLEPNMKEYKKSLLALKENGNALGLHGVTHSQKKFYKTSDSPLLEMKQAQNTLKSITGVNATFVRTPFGSKPSLTETQRDNLEESGFSIWDWCIDSYDWKFRDSRYVNEVIKQLETKEAEHLNLPNIILLHDRPETVNSLQSLINRLKEKGYSFDTLDEKKVDVFSFR